MKKLLQTLSLVLLFTASTFSQANLSLQNLSETDLENSVNDLSSLLAHTSVSPASSLGTVFGLEFGIVGGVSDVPNVKKIAAETGESVDMLPAGALLAMVSVPMGFTIEAGFLPSLDLGDDVTFNNTAFGVKWTMTDILLDLPVDLALKYSMTQSELSFNQTVSSVNTKTTYKSTVSNLSAIVSKSFAVVEPYAGIGYVSADGELSVDATVQIFDFTSSQSASSKPSGTAFFAGIQANLLLIRLGYEFNKMFDATKHNVKLSFYF